MVRLAHFHLARWDDPECPVQIDFAPLDMKQLTGPHKHMWGNLQSELSDPAALLIIDRAQQLANLLGIGDLAIMRDSGGCSATRCAGRAERSPCP